MMELKGRDTVKNSCIHPFQAHVNHTTFTMCQLKDWAGRGGKAKNNHALQKL